MDYDKIYKLAMFFEKRAQEKPTSPNGTVIEKDKYGNPVNIRELSKTPNKSEKEPLLSDKPWDKNKSDDKETVIEKDKYGNPVNIRDLDKTPNKSEKSSLKMPWDNKDDED